MLQNDSFILCRYVPPPPSRPRYNNIDIFNNNDIKTNHIPTDRELSKAQAKDNGKGFFVDVPPKFYKVSPAKQQFYQQQYLNDVFSKNYYSKANKYSVIAFKDKYRGLPYYVVSGKKRTQHFYLNLYAVWCRLDGGYQFVNSIKRCSSIVLARLIALFNCQLPLTTYQNKLFRSCFSKSLTTSTYMFYDLAKTLIEVD